MQLQDTVNRIRAYLKAAARGSRMGVLPLIEKLNKHYPQKIGALNWREFSEALMECGLVIQDIKLLFQNCPKNSNNSVVIDDFLQLIRGPMSETRRALIRQLFYLIVASAGSEQGVDSDKGKDDNDSRKVSVLEIVSSYQPANHSDVKCGRRLATVVLNDLTNDVQFLSPPSGYFSLEDFVSLFHNLYCLENETDFSDVMKFHWKPLNSVKNASDDQSDSKRDGGDMGRLIAGGHAALFSSDDSFLHRIRSQLRIRGLKGVASLKRCLEKHSEGSVLNLLAFRKALKDANCSVPDQMITQFFFSSDKLNKGYLDYPSILETIVGSLSPSSQEVIDALFFTLDSAQEGSLRVDLALQSYDADNHADVRSKRKTARDEYRDFLDGFEMGSELPQRITKAEMTRYYSYMALVLGESEMVRTLRDTWHLSDERITLYRESLNARPSLPLSASASSLQHEAATALSRFISDTAHTSGPIYGVPSPPLPISSEVDKCVDGGVTYLLARVRKELVARGRDGIINFQRDLRSADKDGDKRLSLAEFLNFCRKTIPRMLTDHEVRSIFDHLDARGDRLVQTSDIMGAIRGPMSSRSSRLALLAFDRLDKHEEGIIDAHAVASGYDASRHPDVLAGRRSAEAEYQDFLDSFDVGGEEEGRVTRKEFADYYANVGAALCDDSQLCHIIGCTWLPPADYTSFLESFNMGFAQPERLPNPQKMGSFVSRSQCDIISLLEKTDRISAIQNPASNPEKQSTSVYVTAPILRESVNAGVPYLLQKVGNILRSRGKDGFLNFQRRLRAADADKDSRMNLAQFTRVMKESFSTLFTYAEGSSIYNFLDHHTVDNRRLLSIDDIMNAVRAASPLSPKAARLVQLAFDQIDVQGVNSVDAHAVASGYDASRHPDVLAGRRSAEAEYQDFLDSFDVGGEEEGRVTRKEFADYYANVGAALCDDSQLCHIIGCTWLGAEKSTTHTRSDSPAFIQESSVFVPVEPEITPLDSPSRDQRRFRSRDLARSKEELNNNFIFSRPSSSTCQSRHPSIKNLHHYHSVVIFPEEELSEEKPLRDDNSGKFGRRHVQLRKSAINFFLDDE